MLKYLVETALILGAITILLLLFFKRKISRNNIFLALSLFSIWYALLINYLNQTQLMLNFPWLFRTGNIAGYLILTFLYIYSRNTFYPGIFWRKRDWILVLPALFYVIDMIPIFAMPADQKLAIMRQNFSNPLLVNQVSRGWIAPKYFHFIFRYIWGLALMVLLVRIIFRNRNFATQQKNSVNRPLFWFIVTMTALRLPLIFPGILGTFLKTNWYNLNFLSVNLSVVLVACSLFFLVTPTILYGFLPKLVVREDQPGMSAELSVIRDEVKLIDEPAFKAHYYVREEDMERIISKVESHMKEKLPFLKNEYTIHDLGRDLDVPVYQLSPIINHYYKSNFSSWMNRYRVNYFVVLCGRPENKSLTLDALAKESGFSNRTTFTNAFKKEKNQTPGFFLKQQEATARRS